MFFLIFSVYRYLGILKKSNIDKPTLNNDNYGHFDQSQQAIIHTNFPQYQGGVYVEVYHHLIPHDRGMP